MSCGLVVHTLKLNLSTTMIGRDTVMDQPSVHMIPMKSVMPRWGAQSLVRAQESILRLWKIAEEDLPYLIKTEYRVTVPQQFYRWCSLRIS